MDQVEIFGSHEPNTLEQLRDVASRAERAALMADGHLGYVMPIGGVAAYRDKVSVVGVGFDIACGNAAIRTDLKLPQIQGRVRELADEIQASLSFGIGRKNRADDAPTDDPLFEDAAWEAVPDTHERDRLRAKAREVVSMLGGREVELVHNHHNFAWIEEHGGEKLYVVRKGATPAFPGQKGFVGGSMGDNAVILQGATAVDSATQEIQARALYSTVHGAGRVMSRTAAAG